MSKKIYLIAALFIVATTIFLSGAIQKVKADCAGDIVLYVDGGFSGECFGRDVEGAGADSNHGYSDLGAYTFCNTCSKGGPGWSDDTSSFKIGIDRYGDQLGVIFYQDNNYSGWNWNNLTTNGVWTSSQGVMTNSGSGGHPRFNDEVTSFKFVCGASQFPNYGQSWPCQHPQDTQPPTMPGNFTATAVSTSQINLSWIASSDNVGVAGYTLYRETAIINSQQSNGSSTYSFQNTGLSTNTTYSYKVEAYDAKGNHSPQASASATTQASSSDSQRPSTPTNVTATVFSSTQIDLSWTASTDNVGVTGYRLLKHTGSMSPYPPIEVTSTSYRDEDLTASTTYYYTVSAHDAVGNYSAESAEVNAHTMDSSTGHCGTDQAWCNGSCVPMKTGMCSDGSNVNECTGMCSTGSCASPQIMCGSSCQAPLNSACPTSEETRNPCTGVCSVGGTNNGNCNNPDATNNGQPGECIFPEPNNTITNPAGFGTPEELLSALTTMLYLFAAPLLGLMILWGAFLIMTSGGQEEKYSNGMKAIRWGVIGFIVILLAGAIAAIVRSIIG